MPDTPPGLREPWQWIQPASRADLIQRLKDGMNYNVPARERENLCSVAFRDIEALHSALKDLLEQVDSLDSYTVTRDIDHYKAEACWDDALHRAHKALERKP